MRGIMVNCLYGRVNTGCNRYLLLTWLVIAGFIFTILFEASNFEPPISGQSIIPTGTRAFGDADDDDLADDYEVMFSTDYSDPDSDDDGILDGHEGLDPSKNPLHIDNDPDGDGLNNALDPDSDDDNILDGTEKGITEADINASATDQRQGNFFADQDPLTTTDPTNWDTDGDTLSDGSEDRNSNGIFEPDRGESDPNLKDFDNDGLHDDTLDNDDDNDEMPDVYENLYTNALDPLDPNDADLDYDNDGYSNYREYLGNDNKAGNKDWSNPEDAQSIPNIAPVVEFISNKYYSTNGEKIPRITWEAHRKIIFNDSILKLIDENPEKGLNFTWDWGDGSGIVIMTAVVPGEDALGTHSYSHVGAYTIILQVEDDIGNVGEGKLNVEVIPPTGGTKIIIDISRDKAEFQDKNTIQRQGWISYKLKDVRAGDKITIDYSVVQKGDVRTEFGVRVFVIPESNFDTFKNNQPGSISYKYEKYWSGLVNKPEASNKMVINAESDDTLIVIFDNRFYSDGKQYITFDEPVEYEVSITREESAIAMIFNWVLPLGIIIILIIVVVIVIYRWKRRY